MAIEQVFNARELVTFADTLRKESDPELWEILFPSTPTPSMELKWVKSSKLRTVLLRPSTLDEKAPRRDMIGAESITNEMPFFREELSITEKMRQEILTLQANYAQQTKYIDAALKNLYENHAGLINGGYAICDLMSGSLITKGRIAISAPDDSGRDIQYDYDYDDASGSWASNNVTTLAGVHTWTSANAATSDPIQDILTVIRSMRNSGKIVKRLVMNSETLVAFYTSNAVKQALHPLGGSVTPEEAIDYIQKQTKLEVIIYDRSVANSAGSDVKVIEDGYLSFLPADALGEMNFAPTPESFDLEMGKIEPRNNIAISGDGIAVQTEVTGGTPKHYNTIVSMSALPSFTMMDMVAVLKAF